MRETSVSLYVENQTRWTSWLRSVAGLRGDRFQFDVDSSIAGNSGKRSAGLGSPKLSLVFGPWARTEYFINYGEGFHSNDARGTVETVTPQEREPTAPVTPLARSKGGELGLRTEIAPGLQSSLALWQLRLDSELVFSGDAGDTDPSRASRRSGHEWNNHWIATPWLLLDADIALSRARFSQFAAVGDFIPGSVDQVASLGATVTDRGPLVWPVSAALFRTAAADRGRLGAIAVDDAGLSALRLQDRAERQSGARRLQPVQSRG